MSKTATESDVRMPRDEYRNGAERQPGRRFERMNGTAVAMAPERAEHNERRMAAWLALHDAVHTAGLSREVFAGGMTVEVGDSDYEPDAIIYYGRKRCGRNPDTDSDRRRNRARSARRCNRDR